MIKYILKNITYTGKLKYKETIIENTHKPIITQEEYQKAQEITKRLL